MDSFEINKSKLPINIDKPYIAWIVGASYKNKKRFAKCEAFFNIVCRLESYFTNKISTLLLFALPAELILVSIGLFSPKPTALNLSEDTFLVDK